MEVILHACPNYPHFLHGADYNPEWWLHDKSVWDEDMRLSPLGNRNEMSVGLTLDWKRFVTEQTISFIKNETAPMLYLVDSQTAANLTSYVANGGTLYGTYMLGTVDTNDLCHLGGLPGAGLRQVFGILSEEIDTLYPTERQHAALDGQAHELVDYCEVVHLEGANALAVYADGYYENTPAVTENRYGQGRAIYQACRDAGSLCNALFDRLLGQCDISTALGQEGLLPHGITAHTRTDGAHTYLFVENYDPEIANTLPLPAPMTDMLTGETTGTCNLPPYGFAILKSI